MCSVLRIMLVKLYFCVFQDSFIQKFQLIPHLILISRWSIINSSKTGKCGELCESRFISLESQCVNLSSFSSFIAITSFWVKKWIWVGHKWIKCSKMRHFQCSLTNNNKLINCFPFVVEKTFSLTLNGASAWEHLNGALINWWALKILNFVNLWPNHFTVLYLRSKVSNCNEWDWKG